MRRIRFLCTEPPAIRTATASPMRGAATGEPDALGRAMFAPPLSFRRATFRSPPQAPCSALAGGGRLYTVTAKNPLPKRCPCAYAASNSDLRRMRRSAGRLNRSWVDTRIPCLSCPTQSPGFDALRATAPLQIKCRQSLGNELLAALRSTPSQNPASILRGHPRAEPVRALATYLARLVGALHSWGSVGSASAIQKRVARLSR